MSVYHQNHARLQAAAAASAGILQDGGAILQSTRNRKELFLSNELLGGSVIEEATLTFNHAAMRSERGGR